MNGRLRMAAIGTAAAAQLGGATLARSARFRADDDTRPATTGVALMLVGAVAVLVFLHPGLASDDERAALRTEGYRTAVMHVEAGWLAPPLHTDGGPSGPHR